MQFNEQPVGIIKTMPHEWINRLPKGLKEWERTFLKMNEIEDYHWVFNLPGKPKYDILYFYLLFDGAIRFRANIIGYEDLGNIKCYTGEYKSGKIWVQVAAPVTKLREPIPMKGFQGFRYCYEVYE
jgi:hypothetical protein